MLKNNYIRHRINHPTYSYNDTQIDIIKGGSNTIINKQHPLLFMGDRPMSKFNVKEKSDCLALSFWNEVFNSTPEFKVYQVDHIKSTASKVLDKYDRLYPNGYGMSEPDFVRYVQAQSASSFHGIQSPSESNFAYDSFISSLESHAKYDVAPKPWLIPNLDDLNIYLFNTSRVMSRNYSDVIINSKRSSSSIVGAPKFRDYVMINTMEDLFLDIDTNAINYILYAGIRNDRRGKYRLICSTDARIRIMDYLLVNGSYEICEPGGFYGQYTTEGYNSAQMWVEYKIMSVRDGYSQVCLDYKGFDSQISQFEYFQLVYLLNQHRLSDPHISKMVDYFGNWLKQPKPVVTRDSDRELNYLTSLYQTLPSGLHGTHSFENLIGISMYKEAIKRGIDIKGFKTNGDDQNVFVADHHIDIFIEFVNEYFRISWDKSLVGHKATVWGKQWFTSDHAPVSEMGTIRSLLEREGGDVNTVEESKLESNYSKIVQVLMTLIRLECAEHVIIDWMETLCSNSEPRIDPYSIPVQLQNVTPVKSSVLKSRHTPRGLNSVKSELIAKNLPLNILGASNGYEMMLGLYYDYVAFENKVIEVDYHPSGKVFTIKCGKDYSYNYMKNVPKSLQHLVVIPDLSVEDKFIRSVLQNTKSYDGSNDYDYLFEDMFSLAKCLVKRNNNVWKA